MLTKLQVPAGKAIAIAAMPTAVLLGMGLTPRLAQADELPQNPFTGRACADGSSETPSAAAPSPSPSSSGSSGSARSAGRAGTDDAATSGVPEVRTASWSGNAAPSPSGHRTTETGDALGSTGRTSPRDASGGGVLYQLLGGGGSGGGRGAGSRSAGPSPGATTGPASSHGSSSESSSSDSSSARSSSESSSSESSSSGSSSSGSSSSGRPSARAARSAAEGARTAGRTPEDTTRNGGGTATRTAGAATAASPSPSASASSGATPYPCPSYDARALADAQEEQTPAVLPDDPWILETDLLTLHGLDYRGVVRVRTHDGTVKNVLKFTAESVDIRNLHQITEGAAGKKGHVQAAPGSVSTFRGGTVTMYTQSLRGNLYGLIPVTFTPETPPPLNVSEVFFTDVTVIQAGQFGGTLTIPGMHVYQTDD